MSIKKKVSNFLYSKGFKLIDEEATEYFGDFYCIYSNSTINVRLVSDRSIETFDVSSALDFNRWIDLALIKALINGEQDLSKVTPVSEYSDFLESHLSIIYDLLSKQNYPSTKKKIEMLEKKKKKQMFPNI